LPAEPSQAIGAARVLCLLGVAVLLAVGQMLFKLASSRLITGQGPIALLSSLVSLPLLGGLLLYGVTTLLWVYLLRELPLSRAYPFMALAFALVPILSWFFFREGLDLRYGVGLTLMLLGLYLVAAR
jgi:undecaprenyl phosphate-alpha-L-ara4N flippase subunit ArnE